MRILAPPIIYLLGVLIAGADVALAAEQKPEQNPVVIEDLTPRQLRAETQRIEEEFYRVFNILNDDDDYDIICHSYTPTGSNRSRRACEPQFMIDQRSENASDYRSGIAELMNLEGLRSELQLEFEELTAKLNAAAQENQYFRELGQVLSMLRDRQMELAQ
jgi:hypothetical protein